MSYGGLQGEKYLVSPMWLSDHLSDPEVVVLEVGLNRSEYSQAHLPRSFFWSVVGDILDENFRLQLDPERLAGLLSRSGVDRGSKIVLVDHQAGVAGWVCWYLGLFGIKNVFILDGGKNAWVGFHGKLTDSLTGVKEKEINRLVMNTSDLATIADVLAAVKLKKTKLVDVRTREEFEGKIYLDAPPINGQRSGHIESAIHLPIHLFFEPDGRHKSPQGIAELLSSNGIARDDEIIVYCAVGGRSGGAWFAIKKIFGHAKVQNYSGSWREWSSDERTVGHSVSP